VDAVLLIDVTMTDYAITANAELIKKFGSGIVLNKKGCLPHISLAMGCIKREDVAKIGETLKPLAAIAPRRLKVAGIQRTTSFSGEIVSVLQVERSNQLQNLHEKICEIIKPWFTYDITENVIEGGQAASTSSPDKDIRGQAGQASESTLQWIRNYPVKSSYSNFSPHITIGYGDLPDRELPADFTVSRLAMFHLGNHCTCTKILWSVKI
jgi:2'-5' RNA ligase